MAARKVELMPRRRLTRVKSLANEKTRRLARRLVALGELCSKVGAPQYVCETAALIVRSGLRVRIRCYEVGGSSDIVLASVALAAASIIHSTPVSADELAHAAGLPRYCARRISSATYKLLQDLGVKLSADEHAEIMASLASRYAMLAGGGDRAAMIARYMAKSLIDGNAAARRETVMLALGFIAAVASGVKPEKAAATLEERAGIDLRSKVSHRRLAFTVEYECPRCGHRGSEVVAARSMLLATASLVAEAYRRARTCPRCGGPTEASIRAELAEG